MTRPSAKIDPTQTAPDNSILSQHVRAALKDYFARLDGVGATQLYELVLCEVEQPLIQTVLEHCEFNQTKAAQVLGLSRSTLRKKMNLYGIE
ncbi:MAG: DNA-binding protein Fis [Pseudomonadota bacterium]|jgi:Fis family transcriptional regulator